MSFLVAPSTWFWLRATNEDVPGEKSTPFLRRLVICFTRLVSSVTDEPYLPTRFFPSGTRRRASTRLICLRPIGEGDVSVTAKMMVLLFGPSLWGLAFRYVLCFLFSRRGAPDQRTVAVQAVQLQHTTGSRLRTPLERRSLIYSPQNGRAL